MRLEDQVVKARTRHVLAEDIGDEVVVYDVDTDEAHLLSPNVTRVWRAIQGGRPVAELIPVLEASSPGQGELLVWETLVQLRDASLLDGPILTPTAPAGITRRTMLKRLGLAAAAIPVITTIVAPTPAAAVSCVANHDACVKASPNCCVASDICNKVGGTDVCCTDKNTQPSAGPCNGSAAAQAQCCSGTCRAAPNGNQCS
jgi:hypothetical protein